MFATDCTLPVPSPACQSLTAPPYLVWGIDWSRPWLESVRRIGEPLALCIAQGLPVHVALNRALPVALQGWQFVPQSALPEGVAYEAFIHKQQCIPTRDNWHDFFNGLVWLHWPQLKQHLNRLQAAVLTRDGVGAQRGPLRDALTVLDENGAIWWAPQALITALRERQWQRLMVELRPLWEHSRLLPVGHALMEKLVQPRKPICAHVLCLPIPQGPGGALPEVTQCPREWDAALPLEPLLQPLALALKPFAPLPVLGVPGWWAENSNFSFYDDSLVFRGQRPTNTNSTPGPAEVTTA